MMRRKVDWQKEKRIGTETYSIGSLKQKGEHLRKVFTTKGLLLRDSLQVLKGRTILERKKPGDY